MSTIPLPRRNAPNAARSVPCPVCGIEADRLQKYCPTCGAVLAPAYNTLSQNDTIFLLNPINQRFVRGETDKLPASGVSAGCQMLLLLIFVIAGFLVIGAAVHEWQISLELSRYGAVTKAAVFNKYTQESDDSTDYVLAYRYRASDQYYNGHGTVSADEYNRTEIGKQLDIRYSTLHPALSRLGAGAGPTSMTWFLTAFSICWNGIVLFVFSAAIIGVRQNHRLAQEGRLLSGQILECTGKVERDSEGDRYFEVKVVYRFLTPDGIAVTAKANARRPDLEHASLPGAGTPVAVLYVSPSLYRLM